MFLGHTRLVRWLDAYIDGMRNRIERMSPRPVLPGPFSRGGSIINAIVCTLIGVFGIASAFDGRPAAVGMIVPVVFLEIVFVRICIRAQRGDFDEPTR